MAQGVEAHARTSGVGREKQTFSSPPPGKEAGRRAFLGWRGKDRALWLVNEGGGGDPT